MMNITSVPIKDQLKETLLIVQNKLRNHIVRLELGKYLDGTKLLTTFETTIINISNNINLLNEVFLETCNNQLKIFLENTKGKAEISVYHVKIIDSMNFIINNYPQSEINQKDSMNKQSDSLAKEKFIKNFNTLYQYSNITLKEDFKFPNTKNTFADLVIMDDDKILAIIEFQNGVLSLKSFYIQQLIKIAEKIQCKLYFIHSSEEHEQNKILEYDLKTQQLITLEKFPDYETLLDQYKLKQSNIWNQFIKQINLTKLSNIQRGIDDDNLNEGVIVRKFLDNYGEELKIKLPYLKQLNFKLNQHPMQVQWTPENGFRLSYFSKGKYLNGLQLNLTLWANWGGGVFIKDNADKIFNNDTDLNQLIKDYPSLEFVEEENAIFALRFNNGFPNETDLIEGFNNLIKFLDNNQFLTTMNSDLEEIQQYDENSGFSIATHNNDNPKGEDTLGITDDVNALAKVIAFKKLQPPLSIGLFGNWGSGKSFFMKEIENKIGFLSKDNKEIFCQNIVHIKFNAWHYSDSNLWASLVSKIFRDLDKEINKDTTSEQTLFEQLESSKIRKKELDDEINLLTDQIKKKEKKLKKIKTDKLTKSIEESDLSLTEISKEIFSTEDIQNEVKDTLDELKDNKVFIEVDNNINSFINLKNDFTSIYKTTQRFFETFTQEKSFKWWFIGSLIFAFLISYGTSFLDQQYFIQFVTPILALVTPTLLRLQNFIQKIKPFSTKVNNLLDKYEELKEQKIKDNTENNIQCKIDLESIEQEIKLLQSEISSQKTEKEKLKKEIEDISSGKHLADFISERSKNYKNHLGLISIIRDDFEKLSEYIKLDESKIKIERIILYIDDLDRCNDDIVIDVLEAIHLLLAFELFVVIVGVDVRWISNSLTARFGNLEFLSKDNSKASPIEYLEKIFQIPFHIEKTTNEAKKIFIDNLLKSNIETEKKENIQVSTIPTLNRTEKNIDSPAIYEPPIDIPKVINEDLDYQSLKISMAELTYIKDISVLLPSTPRSIKRFINIYMIIRSHEKIHLYKDQLHYRGIILLLTIVFKDPRSLQLIEGQESFNNCISQFHQESLSEEIKESFKELQFDDLKEHLSFLLRFSFQIELINEKK